MCAVRISDTSVMTIFGTTLFWTCTEIQPKRYNAGAGVCVYMTWWVGQYRHKLAVHSNAHWNVHPSVGAICWRSIALSWMCILVHNLKAHSLSFDLSRACAVMVSLWPQKQGFKYKQSDCELGDSGKGRGKPISPSDSQGKWSTSSVSPTRRPNQRAVGEGKAESWKKLPLPISSCPQIFLVLFLSIQITICFRFLVTSLSSWKTSRRTS